MLKSEALVLVAQFPDNEFSNIFRKHRNARIGEAKKNQQVGPQLVYEGQVGTSEHLLAGNLIDFQLSSEGSGKVFKLISHGFGRDSIDFRFIS